MNRNPHSDQSWIGIVVLVIIILFVILLILSFLEVEPFYSFRASIRKWVQNFPAGIQQAFTPMASPVLPTTTTSTPGPADVAIQTIGNWSYTLNSVNWSGNMVTVGVTIQNVGSKTYPFGFGYQVSDQSFTSIYKLCAVDSNRLVFWDMSVDTSGTGFYNRNFGPGEKQTGTLKFTVGSESQKVYLCISSGGNPANKLFYLGNPR